MGRLNNPSFFEGGESAVLIDGFDAFCRKVYSNEFLKFWNIDFAIL